MRLNIASKVTIISPLENFTLLGSIACSLLGDPRLPLQYKFKESRLLEIVPLTFFSRLAVTVSSFSKYNGLYWLTVNHAGLSQSLMFLVGIVQNASLASVLYCTF